MTLLSLACSTRQFPASPVAGLVCSPGRISTSPHLSHPLLVSPADHWGRQAHQSCLDHICTLLGHVENSTVFLTLLVKAEASAICKKLVCWEMWPSHPFQPLFHLQTSFPTAHCKHCKSQQRAAERHARCSSPSTLLSRRPLKSVSCSASSAAEMNWRSSASLLITALCKQKDRWQRVPGPGG